MRSILKTAGRAIVVLLSYTTVCGAVAYTPTMQDYCITPPFISQQVPPQVLFTMGKDHKMYNPAYNDYSDIAGPNGEDQLDGILETGYRHSIDYYGFFDSYKCYNYSSGVFTPFGETADKYCTGGNAGKWSGNFLNWVAMSRADIIKLVIYGGYRTSDNNGSNYAEISGEWIPQDGHAWGKEYLGSDASKLFPIGVNNKRALFCVVGVSSGTNDIAQLKVIPDESAVTSTTAVTHPLRAWSWVAVDGSTNICSDNAIDVNNSGTGVSATLTGLAKYNITVRVCQPDAGFMNDNWEKAHCKMYGTNGRPVGLMQIYGEQGGGTKVCSKDLNTPCTSDTTCSSATPSKGQCVDKTLMYFGLMMGSMKNPQAGGYLRKDIWSIMNETNQQGILQTSDPDGKGLIMKSIESLKAPTTYPLTTHWGNPIGELLYESMRFWAGLGSATPAFINGISSGNNGDNGYFASMPAWERPGNLFPSCSIPFVLLFSDSYNSFDDDQLPGSAFGSSPNSGSSELTNLNVQTLANQIAANEGITSTSTASAMIGQAGTTSGAAGTGACTSKTVSGFGDIRGICPAEGDQRGTYYPAAVALYGHTKLKQNYNVPNANTYVVAFNSIMPEISVIANGKTATVVPYGKSRNGASCTDTVTYSPVGGNDTSTSATKGLVLTPTGTSSTCNTLQTTSFYVMGNPNDDKYNPSDADSPRYDASNNLTYIKFRWASDDIGGSDFDLDMLEEYEICSGSNAGGCKKYDGTALTLAANQIAVTVRGVKSNAGNDAALGFIVAGTGATDGAYLPVKKKDSGNGANGTWTTLPENRTIIFTVTGTGGTLLKKPLWYAAKYGGFNDMDNNGLPFTDSTCDPDTRGAAARNPKCNEWDTKGNGDPDNYFLISNPRQVESQLRNALNAILARTASGTAASILSNSQGAGANILQAVFFPYKQFENNTSVSWTGELQNLWYYVDPFIGGSTIREDTDYTTSDPLPSPNPNHYLNLGLDKIVQFFFDTDSNQTKVRRFNSDGTFEEVFPDDPDKGVMSLWTAGRQLWKRDPSTRTVYTTIDGTSLLSFDYGNNATRTSLQSYLQATSSTNVQNIMKYTLGFDGLCRDDSSPCSSPSRSRTVTIRQRGGTTATNVWKLGDIVSSTPRLQGNQPLGDYHFTPSRGYGDTTYRDFVGTNNYKARGMAYVGANDGMLHAFKLGSLDVTQRGSTVATLSGQNIGREEWGFIPRNTLPYLKYMMDPNYKDNHLFFVDGPISMFDMSTIAAQSDYWNAPRTSSNWKSVLIGSMGVGGATAINTSACTTGSDTATCVKTPILDPADNTKGLGYSSYFALDITNQDFNTADNTLRSQPTLLWEFSDPRMGYSTSGPVMVRLNAKVHTGSHYNHDISKNGRWLAVFASGPTGPINTSTHQMKGTSNQNLKLFVVDAQRGPTSGNVWVIDTGIANAFAGSINSAVTDLERMPINNVLQEGNYQDDVIYVGYTKQSSAGTWTDGGVLRVVIPHDNDPDQLDLSNSYTPIHTTGFDPAKHWIISKVVEGSAANNIGPVTTVVAKIQGAAQYLFFGSGRYFFAQDDMSSQRRLYMVKDPCYKAVITHPDTTKTTQFDIADNPSDACHSTTLDLSNLDNRTAGTSDAAVTNGWYINLDSGERVTTDTVALTNGAVFYTSFIPTGDICSFGGTSYFWGIKYDTGYQLPASAKQGKALIQVSTGAFQEVDISSVLTDKQGRRSSAALPMIGKSASDAPPIVSKAGLAPVKRILHIQERSK